MSDAAKKENVATVKKMTPNELIGDIAKFQAMRVPVLAKREENRAKGKKMSQKIEDECNATLREYNIKIAELKELQAVVE